MKVKVGDLVKIFAATRNPLGIVIGVRADLRRALVLWNNDLHWVGKSNLEVISERG